MPTLADAKEAAEQGNIQQARLMYEAVIQEQPRNEDAWMGLAEVLQEPEDKRICYKNVLKINKRNQAAKEGLRSLDPQMDPLRAAFNIETPAEEPPPEPEFDEEPDEMEEEETTPAQTRRSKRSRTKSRQRKRSTADIPTPFLVAIGLALSVIVFVLGGSGAFYLITTFLDRAAF